MGYANKQSKRNPNGNRRRKVSEYGTQLQEKQKVKFVYGVLEKQFYNYYLKASNMKGPTGENMMTLLELRLGYQPLHQRQHHYAAAHRSDPRFGAAAERGR